MKKILLSATVGTALTILTSGLSVQAQECMLGEIKLFGGTYAPRDWAFANGTILPITENQVLFSIYGSQYGGDGRTSFALPDLRGRTPIGTGQGTDLSKKVTLGEKGGAETVKLESQHLPSMIVSAPAGDDVTTQDQTVKSATMGTDMTFKVISTVTPVDINETIGGSSQAISIVSPYLGLNYIVCINGYYPSRN